MSIRTIKQPDQKGLHAAREYAGWHLGYREWADSIIRAYLNPEQAREELKADKESEI